jgi:Zn-dependent protease
VHDSIPLGRIAGIRIGINWSWLIVFGLIAWSLASGVFPAQNKGHSDATYAVMGVAAAIAFFASLLLHELGHALVARREGMEIDGITLWLSRPARTGSARQDARARINCCPCVL